MHCTVCHLLAVERIGFHFRPSFCTEIKCFNFIISTWPIKMTNSKRFVLVCNQFRCIMRVTCFWNQRCFAVSGSTLIFVDDKNWWHVTDNPSLFELNSSKYALQPVSLSWLKQRKRVSFLFGHSNDEQVPYRNGKLKKILYQIRIWNRFLNWKSYLRSPVRLSSHPDTVLIWIQKVKSDSHHLQYVILTSLLRKFSKANLILFIPSTND